MKRGRDKETEIKRGKKRWIEVEKYNKREGEEKGIEEEQIENFEKT